MNMQSPAAKLKTYTRWTSAIITRAVQNDNGMIEFGFEFTMRSGREDGAADGMLTFLTKDEMQLFTGQFPRYAFIGLLASMGYSNSPTLPALFAPNSPLIGFAFDAQLQIDLTGKHLSWDSMGFELLDVAPRVGEALEENHNHALVQQVAESHAGPVFVESASLFELDEAGYHSCAEYTRGTDGLYSDYERREAIFNGKHFNGRRMVKGGKQRTSMLMTTKRSEKGRAIKDEPLVTFLCMRQLGGTHILIPIHVGEPFWHPDTSDADVGQILAALRHRKSEPPKTLTHEKGIET